MFRIELVLTEAVTNIIKYAYSDEEQHDIVLELLHNKAEVSVKITDDGNLFDIREHPDAVLPTRLEEAKEGGLGIHLIRNFANTLDYRRQDNLNILTVRLEISAAPE